MKFYLLKINSQKKDKPLSSSENNEQDLNKNVLTLAKKTDFKIIGYNSSKLSPVEIRIAKTSDTLFDYFKTYALRGMFQNGEVGYFDAVVGLTALRLRLKYAINLVKKWYIDLQHRDEADCERVVQNFLKNDRLAHAINMDVPLLPSYLPAGYPLLKMLHQQLNICEDVLRQIENIENFDDLKFKYEDYAF